ncbi:hypothetical protein KM043_018090 [Ampulex compressa]|nr:hypothetical protein KM043_018090 [Ampulex compressa]
MNRDTEEQRPVAQTICGALQKEPNCKCLVLSVLIYGCLAAVTWCRCANVTKVVINYTRYPIKSTKHVSPCDDGYIYIPVAFMGMLYLVYLVECYHSPIRIDLLHAESQDGVLSKLTQLRIAQPTIWWKAVSYHYVRRKRQVTRYRNGDNYTTTQVYYERINTHAATSFYYYDYCGVKDISKELILDPKIPVTKIALTKGFAFSNMRSATEFEEARSRFFAEQELRDDYMEMREGLDLGYNLNPTTLIAVLGNPWFTNRYIYWCLSALLLSWPLRVIIEYKTQYADYQITKLFGINYDTPISGEPIHASIGQLSQPGSYMLAPSYSEALLMDPAPPDEASRERSSQDDRLIETEAEIASIVPSYSEALLYERASGAYLERSNDAIDSHEFNVSADDQTDHRRCTQETTVQRPDSWPLRCPCPCHGTMHGALNSHTEDTQTEGPNDEHPRVPSCFSNEAVVDLTCDRSLEAIKCDTCTRLIDEAGRTRAKSKSMEDQKALEPRSMQEQVALQSSSTEYQRASESGTTSRYARGEESCGNVPRDMSEPNLRWRAEVVNAGAEFLRMTGKSLENILENGERTVDNSIQIPPRRGEIMAEERRIFMSGDTSIAKGAKVDRGRGAIPKKSDPYGQTIGNPVPHRSSQKLPISKTYVCLKSILKQDQRRYTLITARELQDFADHEKTTRDVDLRSATTGCALTVNADGTSSIDANSRERKPRTVISSSENFAGASFETRQQPQNCMDVKNENKESVSNDVETTRTFVFASPIQEICSEDPFGGKSVVLNETEGDADHDADTLDILPSNRLARSFTERRPNCRRLQDYRRAIKSAAQHNSSSFASSSTTSIRENPYLLSASMNAVDAVDGRRRETAHIYQNAVSFPPYEGPDSGHVVEPAISALTEEKHSRSDSADALIGEMQTRRSTTRKGGERIRYDTDLRRSFTGRTDDYRNDGSRRTNINMETSL